MKITAMANKKIAQIFPGEHELRERVFLHDILLAGRTPIHWQLGLHLSDIPRFVERCIAFDVQILGFEVHPDSPFPLLETCFEDVTSDYDPEWYLTAMKIYFNLGITHMIIPVIDVDKKTLNKYSLWNERHDN